MLVIDLADGLTTSVRIMHDAGRTILCLKDEIEGSTNVEIVLYLYEKVFSIRLNIGKEVESFC